MQKVWGYLRSKQPGFDPSTKKKKRPKKKKKKKEKKKKIQTITTIFSTEICE
jgi:hypothetical protein